MTFPPVIPPATRTDSTIAAGNHAQDHNQISEALTSIVDKVVELDGISTPDTDPVVRPLTLGQLFDKPARSSRMCPVSKAKVNFTSGAADGWLYTDLATIPDAKAAGIIETNYDAEDLVEVNAALGQSWVVDTAIRPASAAYSQISHDLEFLVEGTYMGLIFHHYGAETLRVWIDDEPIETWFSTNVDQLSPDIDLSGGPGAIILNINFPVRGVYRVRIAGVQYAAHYLYNGVSSPRKPAKRPRIYVVSDSYYMSVSGKTIDQSTILRTLTGCTVINATIGGTGYLNSIKFGHPSRLARLDAEDPDNLVAIIVNGSGNDGAYGLAAIQAEQATYYDEVAVRAPHTPIVVIGVEDVAYFVTTMGGPAVIALDNALKAAALAHPHVVGFISPVADNWLTGTGSTAAPNGTGNQDVMIGPDGTHLDTYGMLYHGTLTVERMRPMPAQIGAF